MTTLTDRASLKRELYRLLDTDDTDQHQVEHDASQQEGVHLALQHGLWDAQHFLLESGLSDRWVTTSGQIARADWNGTDQADGGRYVDIDSAIGDDFIRLAGDERRSALRKPNGTRWGHLVDHEDRFSVRGNRYWLQNERLWIARGAAPPNDLVVDYHHRLATLADDTTVDFPVESRPLIVAYAGVHAMELSWVPGGQEMEQKVHRNLAAKQRQAFKRGRRDRRPRKFKPRPTIGTHWFT